MLSLKAINHPRTSSRSLVQRTAAASVEVAFFSTNNSPVRRFVKIPVNPCTPAPKSITRIILIELSQSFFILSVPSNKFDFELRNLSTFFKRNPRGRWIVIDHRNFSSCLEIVSSILIEYSSDNLLQIFTEGIIIDLSVNPVAWRSQIVRGPIDFFSKCLRNCGSETWSLYAAFQKARGEES